MAQLVVRNVDEEIALKLKKRAASRGVSMEEEHRRILKDALSPKRSFKDLLLAIPQVGDDADFKRIPQTQRKVAL